MTCAVFQTEISFLWIHIAKTLTSCVIRIRIRIHSHTGMLKILALSTYHVFFRQNFNLRHCQKSLLADETSQGLAATSCSMTFWKRILAFPKARPVVFGTIFSCAKTSFADLLVQKVTCSDLLLLDSANFIFVSRRPLKKKNGKILTGREILRLLSLAYFTWGGFNTLFMCLFFEQYFQKQSNLQKSHSRKRYFSQYF